jgi:hypothetical protein
MLGWGGASGVDMSIQNILLGDSSESSFNRLNLDLTSETKLAILHGNSKGKEHVFNVVEWKAYALVILCVEVTVPYPRMPVAVMFGAIHRCSSNACQATFQRCWTSAKLMFAVQATGKRYQR